MIEPTLNVDSFNQNVSYKNEAAILRQIYNLITMVPGTDCLNPLKGCNFNSYYYNLSDESMFRELEEKIKDQANRYLGFYLRSVSIKTIKRGDKTILCCFVSPFPGGQSLLVSSNGEISQFTKIDSLSVAMNKKY